MNWYTTPTGGTPIATGNSFTTPSIGATTVYYAAAHFTGCPDNSRIAVNANVTPKPVLTYTSPFYMCDEAYTVIDVTTSAGLVFWYESLTDTNPIFLGSHFVVPNIHQNTVFYAESNFNNCYSDRVAVDVQVFASPMLTDSIIELCGGDSITLDAGNPNMSYLWSTGETTQTIVTDSLATTYSVEVTTPAPENCSKTKIFTISYNTQPVITNVDTNDLEVTINTSQNGAFEYSLDGITYQNSNTFMVNEGGMYMAYVREINQCGFDNKPFVVISIPDFFTPNGDNINDTWSIKGAAFYPDAEVRIFDRYGKLITVLNYSNPSWDGFYNGIQLPSTDYWFVAKINDSVPEIKGHFSMLR